MSGRKFQKREEDFTCEKCGAEVKGTGYTDHCPECLMSKHVDNNPGDRASGCGAPMIPIRTHYKDGAFVITYRCSGCGKLKEIKAASDDNEELLFKLLNAKISR
jgi:phage FluMu protein Com